MIQLLSVTKKYNPGITALKDITFEIEEGEFVFLVGASGSGKTTLIRMLIKEESPSAGKIFFEDKEVTRLRRKHVYNLRRKIGVIFQDFKLINELTAFENVAFAMEAAGKNPKDIKKNVPYLLEIVGLEDRMDFFPKQLSGGEKQRVAIARAMANNPKVLIADEPTGNLDPDSAWDIVQILSKINNWGTTVMMSTHGWDIVNTLHKRVLHLENGQLVRDDTTGSYEDLDEYNLKILQRKKTTATDEDSEKDESGVESKSNKSEIRDDLISEFESAFQDIDFNEAVTSETTPAKTKADLKQRKVSKISAVMRRIKPLKITQPEGNKTTSKPMKEPQQNDPAKSIKTKQGISISAQLAHKDKHHKKADSTRNTEAKTAENTLAEYSKDVDEKKLNQLAEEIAIKEIKLPKRIIGILHKEKINTLADLIDYGSENLQKIDKLTKKDVQKIAKVVTTFVDNLDVI